MRINPDGSVEGTPEELAAYNQNGKRTTTTPTNDVVERIVERIKETNGSYRRRHNITMVQKGTHNITVPLLLLKELGIRQMDYLQWKIKEGELVGRKVTLISEVEETNNNKKVPLSIEYEGDDYWNDKKVRPYRSKKKYDNEELLNKAAELIRKTNHPLSTTQILGELNAPKIPEYHSYLRENLESKYGIRVLNPKANIKKLFVNSNYGIKKFKKSYTETPGRKASKEHFKRLTKVVARLMKDNPSLTRKEAWSKAKSPHNNGGLSEGIKKVSTHTATPNESFKPIVKSKEEVSRIGNLPVFPRIYPLTSESNKVLEFVLREIITGPSNILTYNRTLNTLQTVHDEWNGYLWRNFLIELQRNSDKLTKYYNVKGKFKIEKQGNWDVIKYKK